ncbi:MAG: replicative DNA helicase [Kiritimatiellae bacterium]|nr:replicative DNA helicase [Kiritimatiellia bacterium]
MAEDATSRTPPHSTEAEQAVLGCIIMDSSTTAGDRVMDLCLTNGITEESFFDPRNRAVYSAMLEMNRNAKPLDNVSLIAELKRTGMLEGIGGAGYVESLQERTPFSSHAEYYIGILRDKHLRRKMIERAAKTIENCYDEKDHDDPQAVLGEAEKSFLEISTNRSDTMGWSDAVELSFKRLDAMFNNDGHTLEGLSTGLTHLDEKLMGLKKGEMIVIAARPSVGKTSLAMNIAESVALGRDMNDVPVKTDGGKRHPVMIFSLEMPVEALTKRMIAGRAHINTWRLNRNLCPRAEKQMLTSNLFTAYGQLKDAPIYVDDTAGLDIMDLRARARRAKKAYGIELVVIDYLQLCKCNEKARQSRVIEVSEISQQIKAMAKELKIPVIVLSQLSRANEQRGDKQERPKLSDLRDSGAIEQDADVVFLLRRPSRTPTDKDFDDKTLAIIDVAKNRNGEIGEVKVNFFAEYTRFGDREIERKESDNFQSSEGEPAPMTSELSPEQDPLL